jgi:hypothetical protein
VKWLLSLLHGSKDLKLSKFFSVYDSVGLKWTPRAEGMVYMRSLNLFLTNYDEEILLFFVFMGYFSILLFCKRLWRYFWKIVKLF